MKAKELHDLSTEELQKKLIDFKDELFRLRFQLATQQLENPMRIRDVRKNIARTQTVLRQRELEAQKA
ncbi:50S ribosomal protein l29 [Heliomicrobium modesticaldum Ice1]|uniref:Large ribosomal subunit protein uL29 n=1 Tax=Heliobacterium modesticaldum (strain ATCC 51547 / Ice1) TaxID=498761 RepID=RL29_HELMI|nr:50S ribosomal protein L29 [Heliomicrobium modesticaldum]B0TC64.1 RecName: Full=Large ribosomal subunit protein uL29; AltName: Full=50S ribosomal protein L29 [Heliomicrobium modesticaldum Ice1]ABZ83963.1 50S ribosomal protein l29 [Heliomicrobium modesticaldum Ice1]